MLALRLCYLAGFEQVCRLMQAEHKKQKNNNKFKKKQSPLLSRSHVGTRSPLSYTPQ